MLDRTDDLSHQDVLYHFALDELLCRQTGEGGPAICHLWRHPRAFVMGVRDSRLPQALVVWETGLGGRLDVTNIVHPIISVITNIGMDHTDREEGCPDLCSYR